MRKLRSIAKTTACMLLPYALVFTYLLFVVLVGAEMYKIVGVGIVLLIIMIALKGDS